MILILKHDSVMNEIETLIKYFVCYIKLSSPQTTCGTVSVRVCVYLAGYPVWTELSKAKGGLYSPQQSHHIQVLYPPPGNSTDVTS